MGIETWIAQVTFYMPIQTFCQNMGRQIVARNKFLNPMDDIRDVYGFGDEILYPVFKSLCRVFYRAITR